MDLKAIADRAIESAAADETLAEHDARFHKGVYDPKTMTCEFRERRAKLDPVDGDIDESVGLSQIYTGSAADYTRPSLIHVGSGEGSQVYGWGLYGSTVRGVAEGYARREEYTTPAHATKDGRELRRFSPYNGEEHLPTEELVGEAIVKAEGDVEKAKAFLENYLKAKERFNEALSSSYSSNLVSNAKRAIEELAENGHRYSFVEERTTPASKGNIYEQTFFTDRKKGDESHLLNWYEYVGTENARRINDQLAKEFPDEGRVNYNWKSSDAYRELTELCGTPRAASEFLVRADIDGIKYPVDSYGGKTIKDGDKVGWNYVSFRDDNIRTVRKFVDGKEVEVKDSMSMDADVVNEGTAQLPPDLVAHDLKYHHGHFDPSNGKCKYREDRARALEGKTDAEHQDIIDRLKPEDVDGEEIDRADRLGGGESPGLSRLETMLPKTNGIAARMMQGIIAKKQASDIQPVLNSLADSIYWGTNEFSDDESSRPKYWHPKMNEAAKKLAELVKSGALNEALGLGRVPDGVKAVSASAGNGNKSITAEDRKRLEQRKANIAKDMDMIRSKMQLASPRLAALLQAQLGDMQKRIKGIDSQLAGNAAPNGSAAPAAVDPKAEAKAKKAAEKEAKRKAVADSKQSHVGVAPGVALDRLDNCDTVGRTSVLSDSEFKEAMKGMPPANKIYAMSDFHDAGYDGIKPDGCGTAIFAGDFSSKGSTSDSKQRDMAQAVKEGQKWIKGKFTRFCDRHPDQQFVVIAGNHDHFLGDPSAKDIQWPSNVTYLLDSEATVNGMRIYGTPWCEKRKGAAVTASMNSKYARQPFEIDDAEAKAKYDQIPEGLDILVVHQTPLFDYADAKGEAMGPDVSFVGGKMKHCGSASLTEAIKRAKPKLVICGHLHDGDHRPYKIGDTVVINGAYVGPSRKQGAWTHHEIGVARDANGTGFIVDGEDNHSL